MKYKIKYLIFAIFLIFSFFTSLVSSFEVFAADESYLDVKNDIIGYNLSQNELTNINEWIEETIYKDIGGVAEWYVLALSQSGEYDFSQYKNQLYDYLNKHKISSSSTNLKFALILAAVGGQREDIENILNSSMGKQGIMSIVYGVHLLNNGFVHSKYSIDSAIDELISYQLSDGGWAVSGSRSNPDVTSMVIQALAPYYDLKKVKNSVDIALNCLSEIQLEDGDFISYGIENPESGSQLIVALSSLGIDFALDERFIKNGNNLLDGMLKYRLPDGSFAHSESNSSNPNATVQVFYSLVAYERILNNESGLYILDSLNSSHPSDKDESYLSESSLESTSFIEDESSQISISKEYELDSTDTKETHKSIGIKYIFVLVILGLFLLVVVALKFTGKLNKNNFILFFVIALILILICILLDIKTKDEYYSNVETSKSNLIGEVTMAIKCDALLDITDSSHVPDGGIILKETNFSISKGDSVYDVLIEAARRYSIIIENDGTEDMAYIAGINNIYEFDFGDLSGWTFCVNGKQSTVGCSQYFLSDGDVIEWKYTLTLGNLE